MVKTGSGYTNNYPWSGARLGFDMYGSGAQDSVPRDYSNMNGVWRSSNYCDFRTNTLGYCADYAGNQLEPSVSPTNPNPEVSTFQVGWGNDWTLLQLDFIVPSNDYYHNGAC